jgi:Peptidase family M23
MGSRSLSFRSLAVLVALALVLSASAAIAGAAAIAGPGTWIHPVPGSVARPFVAPKSRYGAGHRGVDFAAAPGTAVHAANRGTVTFAGNVAGSLHVVVAHSGGLRTSYSFLAGITVRRGQAVARGDVVGTAGGADADHVGVVHFGLRVGERYVDPMALFAPADLTKLIRLVPVDVPDQSGFDPPALESRSLAASLRLTQSGRSSWYDGFRDTFGDALDALGGIAGKVPLLADVGAMGTRLLAWARSRETCTKDTRQPVSGGGSGHHALTVAGINSSTGKDGVALDIDASRLGYRAGDVRSFSYAPGGGPYKKEQTWGPLHAEAAALGDQLRAMQLEHPGREVDLIAHSQGGVVVTAFLKEIYVAGDPTLPPIGTVVTLSSPLQGAPAATAVARVRESHSGQAVLDGVDDLADGAIPPTGATSTRQLAENSRFMRRLRLDPLPPNINFTSISATDDFVVPADHTPIVGGEAITVNPPGPSDHGAIAHDPGASDAARLALEQRPLPCVGVVAGIRGAVEPVVISRTEQTAGDVLGAGGDSLDRMLGQGDAP